MGAKTWMLVLADSNPREALVEIQVVKSVKMWLYDCTENIERIYTL